MLEDPLRRKRICSPTPQDPFEGAEIGRRSLMRLAVLAGLGAIVGCDSKSQSTDSNAITAATSIEEALQLTAREVEQVYSAQIKNGGCSNKLANERTRRTYEHLARRLGNLIPNLPADLSTPEQQIVLSKELLSRGHLFYFGAYPLGDKYRMSGMIAKVEDFTWPFTPPIVSLGTRRMDPPPDFQTKKIGTWFIKPMEHMSVTRGNQRSEVIAPGGYLNVFHLAFLDPVDLTKYRAMHGVEEANATRIVLCNELGNAVFDYYLEKIPNVHEYAIPMTIPHTGQVINFTPQDASEAFSDYVSIKYGNEFWGLVTRAEQGKKGTTYELTQFVLLVAFGSLTTEWNGKPALIPKEQVPMLTDNASYVDFVVNYIRQDVSRTTAARDRLLEVYELILGKFTQVLDPLRQTK